MKTIIAGCRDFHDYAELLRAIYESQFTITEIISGCADGVDRMGERYAKDNNIPLKLFPADWELYGKRAGYLRNRDMAYYANALVAIWDGESKGTSNMVDIANHLGLDVYVYMIGE